MKPKKFIVCGSRFGQFYMAALARRNEAYELAGLLAHGSERSRLCARKFGVPLFTDPEELPEDVDAAVVVVRTGVMGGAGTELALALMERGIHVLQEQPVHLEELKKCVKKAADKKVIFEIANFYRRMTSVSKFFDITHKALDRTDVIAVEAACANQVTFLLLEQLLELFPGISQITIRDKRIENERFAVVSGSIAGIPLTIRIYNAVDPADPDNYSYYLQQINLYTKEGILSLPDVHGPVVWKPQFRAAHDFFIREENVSANEKYLNNRCNYCDIGGSQETYRELFRTEWVDAIGRCIEKFMERTQNDNPAVRQRETQLELLTAGLWNKVTQEIGYPVFVTEPYHKFQLSEKIIRCLISPCVTGSCKLNELISRAGSRHVYELPEAITYSYVSAAREALDNACMVSIYSRLCGICGFYGLEETNFDTLITRMKAEGKYKRLLSRWLKELEKNSYVRLLGTDIILEKNVSEQEVRDAWQKAEGYWVGKLTGNHVIQYYKNHIRHMKDLMSGNMNAMILLFPEGDIDLANSFYRENAVEKYFAQTIAAIVRELLAEHTHTPVTILELGAGTGATSDQIIEAIETYEKRVSYIYTDISGYFLNYAEEKNSDKPYIHYQLLDIDKPFAEQGIMPESVDIIIAAGMINNAVNTDGVLGQMMECLNPGGVMLIAEPVGENYEIMLSQAFMMTVPEDARGKDNTTFLELNQWQNVFYNSGIREQDLIILPEEDHPLAPLKQKLFVARKSRKEA